MRVTVLDTETTGLDLSKHEIIQIGLIQLDVKDDGDLVVLNPLDLLKIGNFFRQL